MPEAMAGKMIVLHLDYQYRPQRVPLGSYCHSFPAGISPTGKASIGA
jgi:hypothetical protein